MLLLFIALDIVLYFLIFAMHACFHDYVLCIICANMKSNRFNCEVK